MDHYLDTILTWDKLAKAYQEKFMNMELYNESYNLFLSHLPKENAEIFEIACGPGNITKYLKSKQPDLKITSSDVSPSMVQLAKQNNPEVEFITMDCRDLNKQTNTYDGLMCGFVLPYLAKEDAKLLIQNANRILKEKGILYLSAIEGNYENSKFETSSDGHYKMHMHYYSEEFLTQLLKENNFELIKTLYVNYEVPGKENSTHLILLSRKK
ncbi:MAG: class I SAM-dependent methyltransferase [Sphingobacteriaceae bacterium]|nr:class I SAM-dependent methyltransferase [Sphingobacteriaceae bacterium]